MRARLRERMHCDRSIRLVPVELYVHRTNVSAYRPYNAAVSSVPLSVFIVTRPFVMRAYIQSH